MNKKERKNISISQPFNLLQFGRAEVGTPKVEEGFGKNDWISYGVKNDYPQEIIRLLQNADGLHAALLKTKADMIAGLGFKDVPALKDFIANTYSCEDNNIIAYKCGWDMSTFGGCYLNYIWDANGKSIAKIKHVPFEKVRIQKPISANGEIQNFYISRDWLKIKKEENKPELIAAFDASETEEGLRKRIEQPSQLLFVKDYTPGMDFYTICPYHSNLTWLKYSYEISCYHLKSAINGYMPGLVIAIPKDATPEEREQLAQEINARSGTEEAGKTVCVYAQDKDSMPEFHVLQPSSNDSKFKDVIPVINEKIYTSHQANNVIANIAIQGKLGSTSEIREQNFYFQKKIISPLQLKIENAFRIAARINGLPADELKLNNYLNYLMEDGLQSTEQAKQPEQPNAADEISKEENPNEE